MTAHATTGHATTGTGAGVAIRTASLGDEAAVFSVMERAFDPAFGEGWSAAQTGSLFLLPGVVVRAALPASPAAAMADLAEIIGFSAIRTVADESELLLLAVIPAARGRGIGRLLLDDWLSRAGRAGADRAFLEMRADNPALHLYLSAGAREIGRRPGYYRGIDGTLRDAITMRLPVPPGEG